MSNPAFMSVIFEGQRKELKSLYGKMKRLQERETPLVKNGFYCPQRWLGNLVTRLGVNWKKVYCRGEWSELRLRDDYLYFFTETAWIEEACAHLSAYIAKPVAANWDALYAAAEEWNDDNPDADWPINVKKFEVISNEELWDTYL